MCEKKKAAEKKRNNESYNMRKQMIKAHDGVKIETNDTKSFV